MNKFTNKFRKVLLINFQKELLIFIGWQLSILSLNNWMQAVASKRSLFLKNIGNSSRRKKWIDSTRDLEEVANNLSKIKCNQPKWTMRKDCKRIQVSLRNICKERIV